MTIAQAIAVRVPPHVLLQVVHGQVEAEVAEYVAAGRVLFGAAGSRVVPWPAAAPCSRIENGTLVLAGATKFIAQSWY